MFKQKKQNAWLALLAGILCLSACGGGSSKSSGVSGLNSGSGAGSDVASSPYSMPSAVTVLDNATVWTEKSTAKVLRTDVSAVKADNQSIVLSMGQNESEGAQIEVYAKQEVAAYSISVENLYSANAVLPSSSIAIYVEKYVVTKIKTNQLEVFPVGSQIPDALIPYEKIVSHRENALVHGFIQGFYFDVTTSEATIPGTYQGLIHLSFDGKEALVPLQVKVWDFAISSKPSISSYWGMFNRNEWSSQEMDASDEMAGVYLDTMLRFRMNCELPFSGVGGPSAYAQLVKKYYDVPNFSSYRFYYEYDETVYHNINVKFNGLLLEQYLEAVAELSATDEVNYLDKAFFYFLSIIDEPSTDEQYQEILRVSQAVALVLANADEYLSGRLSSGLHYAYYAKTIRPTLLAIPDLLTDLKIATPSYVEKLGVTNMTYCVSEALLDSSEHRQVFADVKHWFYSANNPVNPYPTTHIDDNLVNTRILSWLAPMYGISGYLNWNASLHNVDASGDVYDNPTINDSSSANGDGFIFYPGAPYDIKGPVPSLRAMSFRDGQEDIEMIYALQKIYAQYGMDPTDLLSDYYASLLSDGKVIVLDDAAFFAIREELAEQIVSLLGDVDVIYESIKIVNGIAKVLFVPGDASATLSYQGKTLSKNAEGKYYLEIDLQTTTVLELTLTVAGISKTVTKTLSGSFLACADFEENVDPLIVNKESSKALTSDPSYVIHGTHAAKLTLQGKEDASGTYTPYFGFPKSAIAGGELASVDKVFLNVNNSTTESIVFTLKDYIGGLYNYIGDYTLAPGWNYLTINGISKLSAIDKITNFYFMTANFADASGGKVFYVDYLTAVKI